MSQVIVLTVSSFDDILWQHGKRAVKSYICNQNEITRSHEGHGEFARACAGMVQARSRVIFTSECSVIGWFRYTTPPLPRVIKGAEWQAGRFMRNVNQCSNIPPTAQRIIVKLRDLCREKKDKAGGALTLSFPHQSCGHVAALMGFFRAQCRMLV